ncbi:uncharacterized protein [Solanum lycopersicum]|uniref:uncharacterized protein n=1 Tax=Solanum lycopersicum TaxID=4081 RepID=UPI0002BCB56B|nr:uncharacterized protein LOC101250379 [Solanum lycopersicum]
MSAKHTIDHVQQLQGKGMIKQIYDYLRGEKLRPEWRCLMFKNAARPKAYFTLWIMLNRKLPTIDRLAKWGMVLNKACVLCKSADESIEHIFIQCHYARKVWERLLDWIDNHSRCPMTWSQFMQWSIQHGKGKTKSAQLFKSILAEGVYGLWNERNKRIFEDKSS